MRTARLLTAAATTIAAATLLAAPASAGGPELQNPSNDPPPPPPPTITVSDATGYEADGSMQFHLTFSAPAPGGMQITSSISHEDTDDADFLPVLAGGIAPGATEYTIHIGLAGDDGVEDVENFVLEVDDNVGWNVVNSSADGFILDGNGPQMEILDASENEGDPGDNRHIDVVVNASYAPIEDITFRLYSSYFGFEAEEDDFIPIDQIVTLSAGATQVTTELSITGDDAVEDDELLPVYAEDWSAGNFALGDGSAILRILNDDAEGDGPPQSGETGGGSDDDTTPTSAQTANDADADLTSTDADGTEVSDSAAARSDGSIVRTGSEMNVVWIVGALLLAVGAFLIVLAAARRSHRPAHVRA